MQNTKAGRQPLAPFHTSPTGRNLPPPGTTTARWARNSQPRFFCPRNSLQVIHLLQPVQYVPLLGASPRIFAETQGTHSSRETGNMTMYIMWSELGSARPFPTAQV